MSSILQSPFMEDDVRQIVPNFAKVAGKLSTSSPLQGRRRIRVVPQSGTTYTIAGAGGANTINFLLSDGQAYADLLSAVISFEVITYDQANGQGQSVVALDDGAFSVFRRCLVSVNSTLCDDVDYVAKKVLHEAYATLDQSWYDNVGSWLGLYKANTAAFGVGANGAYVSKYSAGAKIGLASTITQGYLNQANQLLPPAGNRNKFSIPVCLLTSFFRNELLFPLRNAGQLFLQLNLASAVEACVAFATTGTNVPSPAFEIRDITMEIDMIDLHPNYIALMDEIMTKQGEAGVRWAFDSHLTTTTNLQPSDGAQSVIVSKASQNMRQISVGVQPQAGLSRLDYPKNSTWANAGFEDIQVRLGSQYYPSFTSIGEHRAYMDLQNAYGSPASLDKSGLIDIYNYYVSTPAGLAMTGANYSDMWLWSYCFDRLKHASMAGGEAPDLDGVNTLSSSGSQIVVQWNARPVSASLGAVVMTTLCRFTRILELKDGATRVVG